MRSPWVLGVLAGLAGLASLAPAEPNENARFALHVKAPLAPEDTTPLCGPGSYDPNEENLPCSHYTVSRAQIQEWPGPVVYIMVGHVDSVGILAVSFGVDYEGGPGTGIDPAWVTWTECNDGLTFPDSRDGSQAHEFPYAGGGIRMTWTTCQNRVVGGEGIHVVLGALSIYAYSEAVLQLTPDNNTQSDWPPYSITTCRVGTTNLYWLHPNDDSIFPKVQFGGSDQTWNPCWGTVPTRSTTWGRLKRQYGR